MDYLIPDGYVGWIRIDFSIPSAPPLPRIDDRWVVHVPPNGFLKTSTPLEYGVAKDRHFYVNGAAMKPLFATAWGAGGLIWGGHNGSDPEAASHECFFVGTEAQFNTYEHAQPANASPEPSPGPIASFSRPPNQETR